MIPCGSFHSPFRRCHLMESQASYRTLQQGDMLNWYRIERILGRGGFGVIYLATDTNLDYQVAIKEYIPGDIATRHTNSHVHPITEEHGDIFRWGMERFIKEARNLVKFNHPNIVRIMSVFQQNNTAYMVMEFEEGQDLRSYFKNPDARSEQSLKKLIIPVIEGLTEVHRLGFIHRDIKPANILVRKNGSPVLLDFGSARSASKFTQQSLTALVSVGYAPMEQYNTENDDQQGPWTDIYALGGTLYYGICGKDPVESTQRGAAILNGGKDPLIPASYLGEGHFSSEFLAAVDWALKFKIADRPQSLNDWVPALLRLDSDGATHASEAQGGSLESQRQNRFDTKMLNEMSDATVLSRERRGSTVDVLPDSTNASASTGIQSFAWIALLLSGVAVGLWFMAQDRNGTVEPTTDVVNAVSESTESVDTAASLVTQNGNTESELAATQNANQDSEQSTQQSTQQSNAAAQALENERALALEAEQKRLAEVREEEAKAAAELKAQQEQAALAEQAKLAEQERLAEQKRLAEEAAKAEALAEEKAKEAVALAEQQRLAKIAADKEAQRQQQIAEAEAKRQAEARQERRLKQAILSAQNSLSVGDLTAAKTQLGVAQSIDADDARVETLGFAVDAALKEHNKPVSDADFDTVTRMFDGLHRAIEAKDAGTMDRLAISSDQSKLFKALMSRFERLDIGISGIRVRNVDKSITAVLTINSMVRENGDRATPSEAYAKRTIKSRRVNGGWSKIEW